MPDKKISELPVRSSVSSTDLLPNSAGGTTWGSPISAVSNLVRDDIGIETLQTTESDDYPNIGVGFDAIASNRMIVRHEEVGGAASDINTTAAFQQIITDTARTAQPICLRGYQKINIGVGVASSFAVSGEMDSYTNAGGSLGLTATSGVAQKFGSSPVFAIHGLAIDNVNASPSAVTSIIGAEFGTKAGGLDHPTANDNYGNRRTVQIVPRTNTDPLYNPTMTAGETGIGCDIRNSVDSGYYRFGLVIRDFPTNPNPIGTAIKIDTSGSNGILIRGSHVNPLDIYTTPAPVIRMGSQISTNGAVTATVDYSGNSSAAVRRPYARTRSVIVSNVDGAEGGRFDFLTAQAGTLVLEGFFAGGLALGSASGGAMGNGTINVPAAGYFVNGTKVLGVQGAAVANATDAATVIARLNDLLARCRAHGLILT